jgi:hypothetical protein
MARIIKHAILTASAGPVSLVINELTTGPVSLVFLCTLFGWSSTYKGVV